MDKKLLNYGFQDWQVKILLSNKVLDSVHGQYNLKDDKLYLTKDKITKKVLQNEGEDITNKIQEMIDRLEVLGSENDYTLDVDREVLEQLQEVLENLFPY